MVRIAAHFIYPNMIKISFEGSVYSKTIVLFKSFCTKHSYSIPGHFVQTLAQTWHPVHSLKRTWTGGMGISYLSFATGSMQSTGQKGTHT